MTTALEGVEGSASRPGRSLPPGKIRYPLYRTLSGPQGQSGQVPKISPPSGFDSRTVQPVVSQTELPGLRHLIRHCLNPPTSSGKEKFLLEDKSNMYFPLSRHQTVCLRTVNVLSPPNVAVTLDVRT